MHAWLQRFGGVSRQDLVLQAPGPRHSRLTPPYRTKTVMKIRFPFNVTLNLDKTCWKESAAWMSLWVASTIDVQYCTETAGGGSKSVADKQTRGQSGGIEHLQWCEKINKNNTCYCQIWSVIWHQLLTQRSECDRYYLGPKCGFFKMIIMYHNTCCRIHNTCKETRHQSSDTSVT